MNLWTRGCTAGQAEGGWRPIGAIPKVGSTSLFSGSPTIPGPRRTGGTRGIITVPDEGITSGTMLWLEGGGASGNAESAAPLEITKGRERMKEKGGISVLVSGQRGPVWAWWLLEDRGWTEERSPTTEGSVWRAKNMSGPGPLLESSEWLSVSLLLSSSLSRLSGPRR